MKTTYTSYDQLPLVLNANQVAGVLNISRGQAYALMHSEGFPTVKLGEKRMVVPKIKLMAWLDSQIEQ